MLDKITFLGHVISVDGISANLKKVEVALNWPRPKSNLEIRSFLRLTEYYKRFVQDFSKLVAPLLKLM